MLFVSWFAPFSMPNGKKDNATGRTTSSWGGLYHGRVVQSEVMRKRRCQRSLEEEDRDTSEPAATDSDYRRFVDHEGERNKLAFFAVKKSALTRTSHRPLIFSNRSMHRRAFTLIGGLDVARRPLVVAECPRNRLGSLCTSAGSWKPPPPRFLRSLMLTSFIRLPFHT